MRYYRALLLMSFAVVLFSCRKDNDSNPNQPPVTPTNTPARRVLLKDINIPNLPSPFYHFEYNTDSLVTKADFSSGYYIYDVLYNGNNIADMRSNIFINHDTLRYHYGAGNKVAFIDFIDGKNNIYRHANFTYQGDQLKEISWNRKNKSGNFMVDRILTFTYYPDGNVNIIKEQRPAFDDMAAHEFIKTLEGYDKGINVDDFTLVHDGIHDHLFLFQGFRLQANNPQKETLSVDGVDLYTVSYTYNYDANHQPTAKTGAFIYLSGADVGRQFVTNSFYSYY